MPVAIDEGQCFSFWTADIRISAYLLQRVDYKRTSCAGAATICPAPLLPLWRRSASRRRTDRNVAVGSHSQYVPTLTAAAA